MQTGLIQWTYSVWVNRSYNDHCIFSPTIIIFSAVERKPGSLSSNNGIPTVRFFWTLLIKKEREREREKRKTEISAVLNTINDFADIFHVLNS